MVRGGCLPVRGSERMTWKYDDCRCGCGQVETEMHVLFECTLYEEERERCMAFTNDQNIITIRSPNCVFSNYYMCYLKVFENEFSSSEQAYQWRFMTYIGLNELAKQVLEARTPDQAKEIASRVPRELHKNWHSINLIVMKEILHAKADYNSRFKEELILSDGKKLVESTKDIFWASGMSPRDTTSTLPSFYPGLNQLGKVLNQVRSDLLRLHKNNSLNSMHTNRGL